MHECAAAQTGSLLNRIGRRIRIAEFDETAHACVEQPESGLGRTFFLCTARNGRHPEKIFAPGTANKPTGR